MTWFIYFYPRFIIEEIRNRDIIYIVQSCTVSGEDGIQTWSSLTPESVPLTTKLRNSPRFILLNRRQTFISIPKVTLFNLYHAALGFRSNNTYFFHLFLSDSDRISCSLSWIFLAPSLFLSFIYIHAYVHNCTFHIFFCMFTFKIIFS